jgi:hypothetical protein
MSLLCRSSIKSERGRACRRESGNRKEEGSGRVLLKTVGGEGLNSEEGQSEG